MVQDSSVNCGSSRGPQVRWLAMESGDLRCRLQAAAVGDRVLQQEIAIAMAAEKELQRVAREQCSAVVDRYLAEKRAAASEAKPGSSRSVEAVDAHYEQDAHEQASSMMQKFLAERAELWTAQLRALLQVSSLRQEQSHLLNRLHQQQRLSSGIQDSAQQHEPGSSSASLLVPSASHVPEPTPISSAPLGEARSSTPQQNMGASSSMQPCAAPQQTTTNIVTPQQQQQQDPRCREHQQQRLSSGSQDSEQQHEPGSSSASPLVPSVSHVPEPTSISSALSGEPRSSTPPQKMGDWNSMQSRAASQQSTTIIEQQHVPGSASASAAPQETSSTNLATPKGKGSAAIRRERARLAEERGVKPKGTLNRQRKECKKRRDLKYKQAAAAAAQQRPWWQWKQPNKGGGVL